MSYRMLRGLFVAGLLAFFAIPGADSRALEDKPDAKTKKVHKSEIERLEADLASTRDLVKQLSIDINDLRIRKVLGSGGTNTPLKVRGGAMTFRTSGPFGTDTGDNSYPCVGLSFNYVELLDVDVMNNDGTIGTHVPMVPYPNAKYPSNDFSNWQIDLYDRDPMGKIVNGKEIGIRLVASKQCTVSPGSGITLEPEPDNMSPIFYPNSNDSNPDDDASTYKMRFLDSMCNKAYPSPQKAGDEDSCEHIYSIYVNTSHYNKRSDVKTNAIGAYRCTDGECALGIGLTTP